MPRRAYPSSFWHPIYWPVWIGFGLLRTCALLPYRPMMAVGRTLGRLIRPLAGKRRRIVDINLKLCFPELDAGARRDLERRHFEAVGMAVMEIGIAWWWSRRDLWSMVEFEGREHIDAAIERGRGVILLTAHFTPIEVSGRLLADVCSASPMYRPLANPLLEQLVVKHREVGVERAIPRHDVRLMLRTLRAGKGVWFAPDQNFGAKGSVFAPFFGIPAATNTSLSRFAEMTGASVVPFVVQRRAEGGYRLRVEPPLEGFPAAEPVADAIRYNGLAERWIRAAPEQYNWLHRRFKKRPDGEAPLY